MIIMIIVFALYLKTDFKPVKLFLDVYKKGKIIMISVYYHDSRQLLLLAIIANSKK